MCRRAVRFTAGWKACFVGNMGVEGNSGFWHCAFFFFFQAEDGIRDADVTGVQTCALPIFAVYAQRDLPDLGEALERFQSRQEVHGLAVSARRSYVEADRPHVLNRLLGARSEERRVGKECRSRWSRDD